MNAVNIVQQYGYTYQGDCSGCGGKYGIYKNANYPNVQLKIRKQGGLTKIYQAGQLVTKVLPHHLEQTMKRHGLA